MLQDYHQPTSRRDFIKRSGTAAAGAAAFSLQSALAALDPMRITKVETIYFKDDWFTWVRLTTDNGITGLGETYPWTEAQLGALKNLAPYIIGKDPRNIDRIWRDIFDRSSFYVTGGAEMRALSAINIAQWDILGKSLNAPIYALLGGKSQQRIRVYNTWTDGWGINNWRIANDIEKITRYLLDFGVKAIKIVPYDQVAARNNGSYISPTELDQCLDWVKRIRDTAGREMDIGIECHSRWNLTCAQKIAKSLEPYDVMWIEDILLPDNMQSYSVLTRETSIPITVSERLATRYQFREMLESKACDIAMYDITWCGGISEAKNISNMAETYFIPTAPHTCGGPLLWYSTLHVASTLTNFFISESNWHFYSENYPQYFSNVPVPKDGFAVPPDEPGLGYILKPDVFNRPDIVIETIAER